MFKRKSSFYESGRAGTCEKRRSCSELEGCQREGQQTPPPPHPWNIFTLIKFTISQITKNRQCASTGKRNYPSDPPGKISGSMHGGVPYLSAFKWKSYMNT